MRYGESEWAVSMKDRASTVRGFIMVESAKSERVRFSTVRRLDDVVSGRLEIVSMKDLRMKYSM